MKYTRKQIINELTNRGIKARPETIVKNGVEFETIVIGDGRICPTIYMDSFEKMEGDLSAIVDEIVRMYEDAAQVELPDMQLLANWEWVKPRLRLCLQKKSNEDIVKRDWLDLEEYVRVAVMEDASCKVTTGIIEKWGITADELFDEAWKNTKPQIFAQDMCQIMLEMGMPAEMVESISTSPMIIVTNKTKCHGSIGIKATEILGEIADRYECDLAILPSSIHEAIVYPLINGETPSEFNSMIQEINATEVLPEDVLSNHAYVFHRNTREITWEGGESNV